MRNFTLFLQIVFKLPCIYTGITSTFQVFKSSAGLVAAISDRGS